MNVGELIASLMEYPADTPVCVDNKPIYFTSRCEAYWDGCLGQLIHDEDKRGKQYSIIGWKYTDRGDKINLVTMSLEDIFLDRPDLPVMYDIRDSAKERYTSRVEEQRARIKKIITEVDDELGRRND